MEIGNMVFGNSRGEHPVPRDAAFSNAIGALIDKLDCDESPLGNLYVRGFENDVFVVNPYYWGDCTCGFDERCEEWDAANPHSEDCYQTELHAQVAAMEIRIGYRRPDSLLDALNVEQHDTEDASVAVFSMTPKATNSEKLYDLRRAEEDKIYRRLCVSHGIPWNDGSGCAVHCDCGKDEKWQAWAAQNDHDENCPIVVPNFHHKPSGYKLKWYKYPLRDSYANAKVSADDFRKMMDECIASLRSNSATT